MFINGNRGGFIFGGRFSFKGARDFKNRADGYVYNSGYRETDLNLNMGIHRKWGYSHLNVSLFNNLQEIPDGSRDLYTRKFTKQISEQDTARTIVSLSELRSGKISDIHQHVQHMRALSSSNFIIDKCRLAVKLGVQKSGRREFSHPTSPSVAGLDLELFTSTYDVKFYLPEKRGIETAFGLNGMLQKNSAEKGTEFVIPSYQLIDGGPFVFAKKNFNKLAFSAGLRYDMRQMSTYELWTVTDNSTGFDHAVTDTTDATKRFQSHSFTFSGWSAGLGASVELSKKVLLKTNIARGYRAPAINELSADGVHPGSGYKQEGSDFLKPESNVQADLGLFYDSEHISFSSEGFVNLIDNYVFNQKISSLVSGDSLYLESGNSYPVFRFSQCRALLYGGEVSLDIHPHPLHWLHFKNSFSLVNGVNLGSSGVAVTDSTRYLPFIPPWHTNSELRAELKKSWKIFSSIFFRIGFQYYGAQQRFYSENNTESFTPGFFLLDAGLGSDIRVKKRLLCTLTLYGTNLTDEIYQSHLNRLKYMDNHPVNSTGRSGISNMGRNFNLKVVIPIKGK
jgi:iron complex outermembrane receptor protein